MTVFHIALLEFKPTVSSEELSEAGFTHAFVAEFECVADRDTYIKIDPIHRAFALKIIGVVMRAQTLDFESGVF
ncbi:Dimeric alpha+beta barrel [Glarea lozoyensis ATCC 20868]|uniref:Dimeric alpha+beta barrel n=1 Tax=Glarea lozoyensis (strain ATCC 20868 / MF5171) TaxID=1116229 RepID=S3CJB9_GLAL2|nr:Dimeric alpha+beta barrel [Glarea lozoyensis ATCC 20868]EPE25299.1 Dimeric alpha+beta barrel [Glarea lozoyensis ATCC 20868]